MNGHPLSQPFDLYTSQAMLKANLPTEETLQRITGVETDEATVRGHSSRGEVMPPSLQNWIHMSQHGH